MNPGMTQQSLNALQMIQMLSSSERRWVVEAALMGVDASTRDAITRSIQIRESGGSARSCPPPTYETARNVLLDEPALATSDKVILAAYAICDLYELKEFTGRQVTEFLKETSNEIGNVTAAMTALVQKGWADIASKEGESQQSQKRYTLTSTGIAKTRSLLQATREKRERSEARAMD